MRKAGISDYEQFSRKIAKIPDKTFSFEVFADIPDEMYEQALKINSWGENVYAEEFQ